MLPNSEIDAVVISTPDHWHTQPALKAALHGKDIYMSPRDEKAAGKNDADYFQ